MDHAAGATEVPLDARRVMALDQPAALNLLALGIEPRVVFAGFRSQPPLEQILTSYGLTAKPFTITSPSLEAIAATQPDLIVGSGHPGTIEAYDDYSAIAPTVVVPFAASWQEQLDVTGEAVGRTEEADRLVAAIQHRVDGLRRTLAERGLDGTTISVIGSIRGEPFAYPTSGLVGGLLDELGLGRPAAQDVAVPADQGFVLFSPERLTDHDADTLVAVTGAVYDTEQVITTSPLYAQLDAVRSGHTFEVSADMWLGAFPFAAAWIVEDLEGILLHQREPAEVDALERWTALIEEI